LIRGGCDGARDECQLRLDMEDCVGDADEDRQRDDEEDCRMSRSVALICNGMDALD